MFNMNNNERKQARRYDSPLRSETFTDIVYSGGKTENAPKKMQEFLNGCKPEASEYKIYFGEMHGHTNLSDAMPDIDTYFLVARDLAKLDFCAISDHDHGGVHSTELWGDKWEITKNKVKEYDKPGNFTTILAYERDSYPWYNNIVVYYNSHDANINIGEINGEITKKELQELLIRDDLFIVPHTTSFLESGCDFESIDVDLIPDLIEVYSRWGTDEYFGNPNPVRISCRGGYWHDALNKGAKMGCIGGSDDHQSMPGMIMAEATHINLKYRFPGLTAVLAKENTVEAIFEALKVRRCYALMGGRIFIDFRINGHYMGEEIKLSPGDERILFFDVKADCSIKRVTIVKNCEDYMHFDGHKNNPNLSNTVIEYKKQRNTDFYYLRLELTDGRYAWTSPIWINQ